MTRRAGRDRGSSDGGQLLLLAGFVLVMMFLVASLTLSKISSLEGDVAKAQKAPIVDEFDFVRSRTNDTMNSLVTTGMSNESFNETLDTLRSSFSDVENTKGYDLVLELGGNTTPAPKTEAPHFIDGGTYANTSFDGVRNFSGHGWDGVSDGIFWYEESGDSSGHIKGFAAYIYLADQRSRMEATVLFAVNK